MEESDGEFVGYGRQSAGKGGSGDLVYRLSPGGGVTTVHCHAAAVPVADQGGVAFGDTVDRVECGGQDNVVGTGEVWRDDAEQDGETVLKVRPVDEGTHRVGGERLEDERCTVASDRQPGVGVGALLVREAALARVGWSYDPGCAGIVINGEGVALAEEADVAASDCQPLG